MDWVIVSTGMFTSFLFEPVFGLVTEDRSTVTAIGSWNNRITVTSPQDIGRLTAELVLACTDVRGIVYTSGDTVTMEQLAQIVENVLDKRVSRSLKTVEQLEAELDTEPDDGMRKYRLVCLLSVTSSSQVLLTSSRCSLVDSASVGTRLTPSILLVAYQPRLFSNGRLRISNRLL